MESFGAEDTQKKSEQPLVIRHHDERALRLRDVNASVLFVDVCIDSTNIL